MSYETENSSYSHFDRKHQLEGLKSLVLPPRLGTRGETQEGNAGLSEQEIFQRVALRLPRPFLVEGIAVDFDDGQRSVKRGKYVSVVVPP